jgi:pimeloyl-ACP methyl ester carboxylesterase
VRPAQRGVKLPLVQPTSRSVLANGLRHHVLEWDGGGRATVLCLHGFLDLAWAFHAVAPVLARAGHHVVAPDLRGHGETERVGSGGYYHFMDYVLDVADLVEALARDRLALVGHSMGGSVGAYFSGAFPDRVWRLAILESLRLGDTPPQAFPGRAAEWVSAVHRARSRGAHVYESVEAAAKRIRNHDPLCPEDEARFLAERGTRPAPGGGVAFAHDPLHLTRGPYPFRLDQARAFWAAVRCPVLLVDGSESDPPPEDMPSRIAAFRDARQVAIRGAGHMMMRHRPLEVATVLAEFLRG